MILLAIEIHHFVLQIIIFQIMMDSTILPKNLLLFELLLTGRIQCAVLTTVPFCFSWIKKFLGQQSKIWVDNSVEKLFR